MEKEYVLVNGSHIKNGKIYNKGDKIELTEKEASRLTNKIADPNNIAAMQGPSSEDADTIKTLKDSIEILENRVAELEAENALLQEQIDDQEEEV